MERLPNNIPPGPGQLLEPLQMEPVSKLQLVKYAAASGDFNLIHTDVETARAAGLPSAIAHGMLSMGFMGRYATQLAEAGRVRRLKARFKAMVFVGDVLTCYGRVEKVVPDISGDGATATIEIWVENDRKQRVTEGYAEVLLPGATPNNASSSTVR